MAESEDFGWNGFVFIYTTFSFFSNFLYKCDQSDLHQVLSRVRDLTFELKEVKLHSQIVYRFLYVSQKIQYTQLGLSLEKSAGV